MSEIKNLTLEQAQEKLSAKAAELRNVFKEAETGDGTYDHTKAKSLGAEIKSSSDFVAAIKQRNAELDELGQHIEGLRSIKEADDNLKRFEKGKRDFMLPGQGGNGGAPANRGQFKSLGQQVIEAKGFKDWHSNNRGGGCDIDLDVDPSDFLAKAARFETIGNKALMTTSAGYAPESVRLPGFVEAPTRPIQLLDILPMGRTSQAAVPYMEETTRTHGAGETAEGAAYKESAFAFTEKSVPVVKITDSVPVTDEQLEDAALIESYINGRLAFGIRQKLDAQCLIGNGTAPNMRGILNTVGIQTRAKGADPAMDALYKAMTSIRLIGRAMPTHHNIHPLDWQDIRLTRTSDGIYIFGNPSESVPERLWGLPVIQNDALTEGTALVGSFEPAWIMLFERRGIDIQVGYVGTQFGEGKRTVRADMRGALQVARPAAFHTVTGL